MTVAQDIRYPRARLSPAKGELLALEFSREFIEAGNTTRALAMLAQLTVNREAVERFEGTVTFYFAGWDDDPRETASIPEIRRWFQDLTTEWPYWFHFVEKQGDTFFHILRLLCAGHYELGEPGMVGWVFDDIPQLGSTLESLFGSMNLLHERHGLPEEDNLRISEEVAQLLEIME